MKRATFTEIIEAVDFADMLVTLEPGRGLAGAVDVAGDVVGIPSDRDRRIVRHLLERRRDALLSSSARRAA